MNRIGGLLVALLVLSVFFWLVETLFAANPAQPRLPRRRGFTTDLWYWFATPLVTKGVSQLGIVAILILIYRENPNEIRALIESRETLLSRQPLPVQALEMLVLGDVLGYWLHRVFQGRALRKFHAIHHHSKDFDWLSSVRLHPVNDWLTRWVQVTTLVVLGFSPTAIAAYVPFLTFYAVFLHANVSRGFGPLGRFVASPKFHRWHHTCFGVRARPSARDAELGSQRVRPIDLRERFADRGRVDRDGPVLGRVEPVGARDRMDIAVED
jgi:sterol desaturase/sphingolipid hydroxylase (fatty acid hydroxylase superfamily)